MPPVTDWQREYNRQHYQRRKLGLAGPPPKLGDWLVFTPRHPSGMRWMRLTASTREEAITLSGFPEVDGCFRIPSEAEYQAALDAEAAGITNAEEAAA